MLITKKVLIKKRGNKNLNYYKSMGYSIEDEFYIDIKHLTKSSKILVSISCDFCKKVIERPYYLYLKNIKSFGLFACSHKCAKTKTIKTNLEKYGVEYSTKNKNIKEKIISTNLERYGVKNVSQNIDIKEKKKKTTLIKYGVENILQSDNVRKLIKNTILIKYGVDHNMKSSLVKDLIKKNNIEKYGVENVSMHHSVKLKRKETFTRNYGVEHPLKSNIIKNKIKKTNINKIGVEWPFNSKIIQEASKKTLLKKYGVDHNSKIPFIKEENKINSLKKWGVEYPLMSIIVKEKGINTNIEKWGSVHPSKSDLYRMENFKISKDLNYIKYKENNISIFNCEKGHEFEISSSNYYSRKNSNISLCTVCNPIGNSSSIKENDFYEYISNIYKGEIIKNYKDELEIDVYLPELNLGLEFNGLYWHSELYKDQKYHLEKTDFFKKRGIKIIHVWEDDWDLRNKTIKSQIKNWVGTSENRIYARKCIIKEIEDNKLVKEFLNENHIQGWVSSNLKLGLYYNNQLVSMMIFDQFEGRKKMEDGGWNLSRFCNKLDTTVIGGASKLLKYFIKKYNATRIVSYADKTWSDGNMYYKLGFIKVDQTKPDYKYILENKRVHKSRFRKGNLNTHLTEREYMKQQGIHRIYDCGKVKFELMIK